MSADDSARCGNCFFHASGQNAEAVLQGHLDETGHKAYVLLTWSIR